MHLYCNVTWIIMLLEICLRLLFFQIHHIRWVDSQDIKLLPTFTFNKSGLIWVKSFNIYFRSHWQIFAGFYSKFYHLLLRSLNQIIHDFGKCLFSRCTCTHLFSPKRCLKMLEKLLEIRKTNFKNVTSQLFLSHGKKKTLPTW